MFKKIIASIAFLSVPAWAAQPPFTGTDYSGRYECTGMDSHIGEYKGIVKMTLDPKQSTGEHGAYDFTLTLADNSRYDGFAIADMNSLAAYFAYTDPEPKDYGVGIAKITTTPDGKVSFTKHYYAPEYQGGGYGVETCVKG
ncbi:hypothetical protein [Pseudomonas sp. Irchel s3h17]|uniref:hypothetical protein n=1 Tax=Pseudomonas sp. Irchel s3h17 TaxID=2009182 RepID=UPI000BA46ED9|nr:hypothetical protein [Pseudomonas sp. Irchel s3h17]